MGTDGSRSIRRQAPVIALRDFGLLLAAVALARLAERYHGKRQH
ncbi:hypothetical protein QF037_000817 [Streptomyces canus]|nr:hypothetical protein [Streptomyces canus]MDQ0596472.1 hypothetical protein [Streptomyces canus]